MVKIFLTDLDGTMTDGIITCDGKKEIKNFNTRDGHGFALLKQKDIMIIVISGGSALCNKQRCKKLNVDLLLEDIVNKKEVVELLLNEVKEEGLDIKFEDIVYCGDDINDLLVMKYISENGGKIFAPSDCHNKLSFIDNIFICNSKGGDGFIREVVDILLKE